MQICIRFIVVRQGQRLSYCLGQNESDILFSLSLSLLSCGPYGSGGGGPYVTFLRLSVVIQTLVDASSGM